MIESEFQHVSRRIGSGAKFWLGRNAAGRMRLKLYIGPFGFFTQRYEIDDAELQRLRRVLALTANKRAVNSFGAQAAKA